MLLNLSLAWGFSPIAEHSLQNRRDLHTGDISKESSLGMMGKRNLLYGWAVNALNRGYSLTALNHCTLRYFIFSFNKLQRFLYFTLSHFSETISLFSGLEL